MSFVFERKLPSAEHLKELLPVDAATAQIRERRVALLKKVIAGEYNRLLLIIGPCSADNEEAVLDYIHRLAKVQEKVEDKIFIVPRVYTNKPVPPAKGIKA